MAEVCMKQSFYDGLIGKRDRHTVDELVVSVGDTNEM